MKRIIMVLWFCLGWCGLAAAQDAKPVAPVKPWSIQTAAFTLPGLNGGTIAGVDSGLTFTASDKLDLFERNLLSSDNALKYFAGGQRYRLPALSIKANNASNQVNFLKVRFFEQASFGVVRTPTNANHYGFTAGGGFEYAFGSSGTWSSGATIEYAKFPGYRNSAMIVELGIKWSF